MPIGDEDNIQNNLFVLDSCREEGLTIQRNIFTTLFAHEIVFHYGYESIWAMTKYNEQYSPHNFIKAKATFNAFCEELKRLFQREIFVSFIIAGLVKKQILQKVGQNLI